MPICNMEIGEALSMKRDKEEMQSDGDREIFQKIQEGVTENSH